MRTLLYRWAKTNSIVLVNAWSFVGTTAVTSILGCAYWWGAAQWFPPQAVGLGSAAISAMKVLGTACIVGLGMLLVDELPRRPGKEGSLISAALILVGGIGGCAGSVCAVVAPFLAIGFFQAGGAGAGDRALFAAGVSLTAITFVLDHALVGLLRGDVQFWRNALFAAAKLAALLAASLWLSRTQGFTLYATWVVGNALSLAALAAYAVLKRGGLRSMCWPEWGLLRKLRPEVLQHYLLDVALQAPTLALPLLVTVLLSATTNAWFYISWMIVGCVFVVPTAISAALYTTISEQPARRAQKTLLTLSLAFATSIVAVCVLLLGAEQLLGLFGRAYAQQGASCLRILSIGSFPVLIKYHYATACRFLGSMSRAVLPLIAGGLLELAAAGLGARLGGLAGLSMGWVAAACIEAVFLSPSLYKAVRLNHPTATTAISLTA